MAPARRKAAQRCVSEYNVHGVDAGGRAAGRGTVTLRADAMPICIVSLHSFMFSVLEVDRADRRCDKRALVASCCRPAGGSSAAGRAGWMRASTATPNHRSRRRSRPWEPADSMLVSMVPLLQNFVERRLQFTLRTQWGIARA